jgi:hypothetical protein
VNINAIFNLLLQSLPNTLVFAKSFEEQNVENGGVLDRIIAGQNAPRYHIMDTNWEGERSVSEAIVKLFPRLSLQSFTEHLQQSTLSNLSHLSKDAAWAVIQTNATAAKALEILEVRWAMIASFLIETRADISKLKGL